MTRALTMPRCAPVLAVRRCGRSRSLRRSRRLRRRCRLAGAHHARRHRPPGCGRSWRRRSCSSGSGSCCTPSGLATPAAGGGRGRRLVSSMCFRSSLLVIIAGVPSMDRWPGRPADPKRAERARLDPALCRRRHARPARPTMMFGLALIVAILMLIAFLPVILAVVTTAVGGDAAERRKRPRLTLHFAYGSNMSRAVMRRYAPMRSLSASPRWPIIASSSPRDGYASVAPRARATVHGVLWRITPRDRVTLDAWENIAGGLYRAGDLAGAAGGLRAAGAGLSRAAAAWRPAEGRLYGACGRGRAGVEIAGGLIIPAAMAAAASIRRHGREVRGIPMDVIVRVVIRGRVQGVGYRAWAEITRARARSSKAGCATAATARSRRCSPGRRRSCSTMIELCRRGPARRARRRHRSARGALRGLGAAPPRRAVLGAADGVSVSVGGGAEQRLELAPQRPVDLGHRRPAGRDRRGW